MRKRKIKKLTIEQHNKSFNDLMARQKLSVRYY